MAGTRFQNMTAIHKFITVKLVRMLFGHAGRKDLGCCCVGVVGQAADVQYMLQAVPDDVLGTNVAVTRLADATILDDVFRIG